MAYTKYSLTPSSNTAAPPDGAPEGMLPSAVNDTMRDMMSQIRDCGDGIRDGTYTMTAAKITGGTITGVTFTSIVVTGGSITGITDLAVADGGTGASSFTSGALLKGAGTSAITTATAGTDFVAPGGALGTPSSGTLSSCTVDGTDAVGFRNVPVNSQSAAYTLVLADSGKVILHPASDANARTFTIPANSSVAYPVGTAITFINMTSQVVTIAITTDTMYLSAAGTTGSRSLAQYGSATAIKITSTNWIISGSGLT